MIGQGCAACGDEVARWGLCQGCGHLLAGMCLGKVRFNSHTYAIRVALPHQMPYDCFVCGFPHIGGRGDERHRANITEMRRLVVNAIRRNGRGWLLTTLAEEFGQLDRNEWRVRRGFGTARSVA